MKSVVVDTNVWFAAFNPRDGRHGEAAPSIRGVLEGPPIPKGGVEGPRSGTGRPRFRAVVTDYILDEVATLCLRAARKAGQEERGVVFVEEMVHRAVLLRTSPGQFDAALELYKMYRVDFTDCTVVKVMEDAGLGEIWSFDSDFDRFPSLVRVERV